MGERGALRYTNFETGDNGLFLLRGVEQGYRNGKVWDKVRRKGDRERD